MQDKYTPLHYAALNGQVGAAMALVAGGADKNARDTVSHGQRTCNLCLTHARCVTCPRQRAAFPYARLSKQLPVTRGSGLQRSVVCCGYLFPTADFRSKYATACAACDRQVQPCVTCTARLPTACMHAHGWPCSLMVTTSCAAAICPQPAYACMHAHVVTRQPQPELLLGCAGGRHPIALCCSQKQCGFGEGPG